MKKGVTKKAVEQELKIILKGDDVVVELHGSAGGEQDFADYLVDGVIPTFSKIMDGMEVTDDLKFKIYTKWIKQIAKRLDDLDFRED